MTELACARCGESPRAAQVTDLCYGCQGDGIREARIVEAAVPDNRMAQRLLLMDAPYRWAGWSVRLRHGRAGVMTSSGSPMGVGRQLVPEISQPGTR